MVLTTPFDEPPNLIDVFRVVKSLEANVGYYGLRKSFQVPLKESECIECCVSSPVKSFAISW